MLSPDVNVFVCAFREDAEHHKLCKHWLNCVSSDQQHIGLSELVLNGVLRILTHPRVFHPPTPSEDAIAYVDALLAQSGVIMLRPGDSHWRIFRSIAVGLRLTGNRLLDAYHASLAIEHGCEWVTLDHGFSVYPALRTVNLLYR